MKSIQILCTTIFLLICSIATSQKLITQKADKQLRHETVLCENDRFIWACSNLGLLQINKKSFNTYNFTAKNSKLPSDIVNCGICMSDGRVYIGTKKGVFYWDNYAFLAMNSENTNLPDNDIINLTLQGSGILIHTRSGKTVFCNGFDIKKQDTSDVIKQILTPQDSTIEICTNCPPAYMSTHRIH